MKRFRQALTSQLPMAVEAFNKSAQLLNGNADTKFPFVVNLGDLIESPKEHIDDRASHLADLDAMLAVLANLQVPLLSTLGNHGLKGVPRDVLMSKVSCPG